MHASDPVSRYFSHNLFLLSPRGWGDGSRRMLRPGDNGHEGFPGEGPDCRERGTGGGGLIPAGVQHGIFVSLCEGRTDGGSAQQPPTRTSFSPMNLLTPARIQARSTQRVWVRHALMSSATDFGCKVTARKLRSKIFPPFFSKFFWAINDTCQSIVKLSSCQIVKLSNCQTQNGGNSP